MHVNWCEEKKQLLYLEETLLKHLFACCIPLSEEIIDIKNLIFSALWVKLGEFIPQPSFLFCSPLVFLTRQYITSPLFIYYLCHTNVECAWYSNKRACLLVSIMKRG